MKKKAMWHTAEVKLFVALVLATSVFAAAVNAETRFRGRFTLANEVHWGKAVLPAGEYTISVAPSQSPFRSASLVRSASGKTQFIPPILVTEASNKGVNSLVIMVRGNERRVRSLNLPGLGQSLIYEPLSRSERETLAKTDQAVPVTVAAK
jgi:hypothetical protein